MFRVLIFLHENLVDNLLFSSQEEIRKYLDDFPIPREAIDQLQFLHSVTLLPGKREEMTFEIIRHEEVAASSESRKTMI